MLWVLIRSVSHTEVPNHMFSLRKKKKKKRMEKHRYILFEKKCSIKIRFSARNQIKGVKVFSEL